MCTAVSLTTKDHYFGRTLDLETHDAENVVITPRRFPLSFRRAKPLAQHLAFIGMALVAEGVPLYYDATNECGVSVAALSFPGYARYRPPCEEAENIAPFEFIPWVLGQCASMAQVRALLRRTNLLDLPFSPRHPLTPLHFMIAWQGECLVAEPLEDGLRLHENPVGVMTNSPPFDMQRFALNDYMRLSPRPSPCAFPAALALRRYSKGMGALGLPGDLSSASRFVRAAFTRMNSRCGPSEEESVSQFFHILGAVSMTRGCVEEEPGAYEITQYASCCNACRGVYYYTTYENSRITAVDMRREALESAALIRYPLLTRTAIFRQN